jgi:hypothetical protein
MVTAVPARASTRQSMKGLVTAGFLRSAEYLAQKIKKAAVKIK